MFDYMGSQEPRQASLTSDSLVVNGVTRVQVNTYRLQFPQWSKLHQIYLPITLCNKIHFILVPHVLLQSFFYSFIFVNLRNLILSIMIWDFRN